MTLFDVDNLEKSEASDNYLYAINEILNIRPRDSIMKLYIFDLDEATDDEDDELVADILEKMYNRFETLLANRQTQFIDPHFLEMIELALYSRQYINK